MDLFVSKPSRTSEDGGSLAWSILLYIRLVMMIGMEVMMAVMGMVVMVVVVFFF